MKPLEVTSSAKRLEASFILPEGPARATVILCHGLPSGSPKDPNDPGYPGLAACLAEHGFAAVCFSFRGCYGSEGNLSFGGWVGDLAAVVEAVSSRISAPVVVAGSSLGGAAALLHCAGDDRVRLVATLAAPAHLQDLASSGDDFLERVRSIGLIRDPSFPPDAHAWAREFADLSPEEAVARLGPRPLLVLHGADDDVVPVDHADRLVQRASGPVTKVVLDGAGHQLRRDERCVNVLSAWLEALS